MDFRFDDALPVLRSTPGALRRIKKHCRRGDLGCRRRQMQAPLHWAYDSRKI